MSEHEASDRFTADVFEQEREAAWDWVSALGTQSRKEFDEGYDRELAEMRAEEAAE